jgi:hypothetical protein
MQDRKLRKHRREDMGAEPIRRGDSQLAFELLRLPRKPTLNGERFPSMRSA